MNYIRSRRFRIPTRNTHHCFRRVQEPCELFFMVGNDFAMSEGIWTCGKDGQSVPVGVGLPTVLVSEMTVGGM